MSTTSIGPGPSTGGNENHGSDGCGNKTLGELSSQVPPSGKDLPEAVDKAFPDGPNVGPSPWEKEAAQGKKSKG
jgi:hypothetical protein